MIVSNLSLNCFIYYTFEEKVVFVIFLYLTILHKISRFFKIDSGLGIDLLNIPVSISIN